MSPTQTEDEFDALPDDFEGIDFDSIPELSINSQTHPAQSEDDQFDDFPDPFTGVDWATVPALGVTTTSDAVHDAQDGPTLPQRQDGEPSRISTPPPRPDSSRSSTQYSFDELDAAFLEELDALESRLCGGAAQAPNLSSTGADTLPDNTVAAPGSLIHATLSPPPLVHEPIFVDIRAETSKDLKNSSKRSRTKSFSSETTSPRKKSRGEKGKNIDLHGSVQRVLAEYEDELTCPICCDILTAAHLGNPCGHTFCGECGWGWISKNRRFPTCAICRAQLVQSAPMIPNFAMDNTVEKHVNALAASGNAEWRPGGSKHVEWMQRKERWKASASRHAMEIRRGLPSGLPLRSRSQSRVYSLNFGLVQAGDALNPAVEWSSSDLEDEDYVDLTTEIPEDEYVPSPAVVERGIVFTGGQAEHGSDRRRRGRGQGRLGGRDR
ncbi:hypothetical protein BKA93DRAFT_784219 [Sparassis latifolia]